jgi:type IV secretory pathway VirB4 component
MAKKEGVKKTKKPKAPSTKSHLPIAEIKEGVVVLKDGTLRSILMVSSINFALKSEDEQTALISSYVGFLNSIDFPLQVVVQSRKLTIQPYIENLMEHEKEQDNDLLRVQTADYRAFIKELVDIGEIMTKKFYVIVTYNPLTNKKKSFFSRFKEVLRPVLPVKLKEEIFDRRKKDLDTRMRTVSNGLTSIGLNVVQLDTQALIELYYSTYNPDIAFTEPIGDVSKLQIEE